MREGGGTPVGRRHRPAVRFQRKRFLTPFFLHTALDFPCLMFLLPGRTICRVKGKLLA